MCSPSKDFFIHQLPFFASSHEETCVTVDPLSLQFLDAHSFCGRIWQCVYAIFQHITATSVEKFFLQKACQQLTDSWNYLEPIITQMIDRYEEDTSPKNTEHIIELAESMFFFHDFLFTDELHKTLHKTQVFVSKILNREVLTQQHTHTLQRLARIYSLCSVEGITQQKIPQKNLEKLAQKQPLSELQELEIREWIEVIREKRYFLSPLLIHRMLQTCTTTHQQLENLEYSLYKTGLTILGEQDSVWNTYYCQFFSGMQITDTITLGACFSHDSLLSYDLEIFFNKENLQEAIIIGKNPTALYRFFAACRNNIGFPTIPYHEYGKSGCIAYAKLPKTSFNLMNWSKNEFMLIQQGTDFIKKCIELEKSPKTVDMQTLWVTDSGTIVSLVPYEDESMSTFSYEAMEIFAQNLSQNNLFIFQKIMEFSDLYKNSVVTEIYKALEQYIPENFEVFTNQDILLHKKPSFHQFYIQVFIKIFNRYRISCEQKEWNVLYTELRTYFMQVLKEYKIAATCWEEPLITQIDQKMYKEKPVEEKCTPAFVQLHPWTQF